MTARKISEFPPSFLKEMRDRANRSADAVLTAWGNPELSKEDEDTLRLVSLILVAMSPWQEPK